MDENLLKELAETIDTSDTISLTGAGISVPSGIADFRSEHGLWSKYDPYEYGSYQKFIEDPSYFWEMHVDILAALQKAQPNPAHKALAVMEEKKKLTGVITQNIDGLHQRAGSRTVYELHGTNDTCSCTICGKTYDTGPIADVLLSFEKDELVQLMRSGREIPTCECGGWIKPDVILFGELMPRETFSAAERAASSCALLLVVGSSLQVQPAASIPFVTKRSGGKVAIINKDPGVMDWAADFVFHERAEVLLPELISILGLT